MRPLELPKRWYSLRPHAMQYALSRCTKRLKVVRAGRRSGKTELAKRDGVRNAIYPISQYSDVNIGFAAPTRSQAKRIFWRDLKALSPKWALDGKPSESELVIRYKTGASIYVIGLDEPARVEGSPWDHFYVDEFGNVKASAWEMNIRPALDDRAGTCWLFGVPEGRNHYYDIDLKAQHDTTGNWGHYHWFSDEILSADIIAQAMADMDSLTFQQEYQASFITFSGRAYYSFDYETHCRALSYDPQQPLIICFDFNVAPGTASILQEQYLPECFEMVDVKSPGGVILGSTRKQIFGTGIIGEVYIERGSNTPMVCRKVIEDWKMHRGRIEIYGDATGGSKGTAKVDGSDWDLIKQIFRESPLAGQVSFHVPESNPKERSRVNAVNTRFKTASGAIHMMIDPARAPKTAKDFDGVQVVKGSAGEIDKNSDPLLTHLSDGVGYYIEKRFPIASRGTETTDF